MEDHVVRGLTIVAIAVCGGTLTIIAALLWRGHLRRLRKTGWEAFEQEDYKAAERRLLAALRVAKSYGAESAAMAEALFDLAVFYDARERPEEAAAICERAVASAEGAADARDPLTIAARTLLARLYYGLERLPAAENTCRRVLEDAFATHGENESKTAEIVWLLGNILLARGGREDGAVLFGQALDIWEGDFEQDPEELARRFGDYADFLRKLGNADEADRAASRAANLLSRSVN